MTVRILLATTCPREPIEAVAKYWPHLPCDRLFMSGLREYQVYGVIRNYFLYEDDWTHLVLSSDDLIVKPENIASLVEVLEQNPHLPIISGVCNVDESDYDVLAITPPGNVPEPSLPYYSPNDYSQRKYQFIRESAIESSPADHQLIPVGFCGFPLMAISRDTIEKIPFETDAISLGHPIDKGQSTDLLFCYRCMQQNIPIFADVKNFMKHLRNSGEFIVGKKPPDAVFYAYKPTIPK